MLRFALHGLSQNSQVSTCCHGLPGRDISCLAHVGVRPVPTSHAHEDRLALATLRCDVLARVTGLRRVRSSHFLNPTRSLLLQPGHQLSPPGLKDGPVQPCFLCDVPARLLNSSPGRSGHPFDVEALNPDHIKASGKVCGGLLNPVLATVAVPGLHRSDQSLQLVAAVRSASGAGGSALQPQEPLGFLQPQPSRTGHLTSGQHRREVTPRSTPTTCPVQGAGIGLGITANAIYHRPALSPVIRYDFQPTSTRLRLNQTQPIFGTSTLDRARLSCLTRNT
jgi:hypothetical protein